MKNPYIYAAISIFCWSTVATTTKLLLHNGFSNIQLLWVSSFLAFLFLLFVNLFTNKLKHFKNYKPKDFLISVAIGLPGTFFYYFFYYWGTAQMPASQAFIINYLWPIMCLVFAVIILKEKITLRSIVAICISFLGIVVIMLGNVEEQNPNFFVGAFSCILGAVSYGIFTALNKKYTYDKGLSMMLSYFVTFLLTTAINASSNTLFIPSASQWLGYAWNGIFTMAIANTVWLLALDNGKTEKIANLAYITPFLSILWTSLILKEKMSIYSIIGFLVIISGILIQIKRVPNNQKNSETMQT